jgi:lysophospholipase L1-like esterase
MSRVRPIWLLCLLTVGLASGCAGGTRSEPTEATVTATPASDVAVSADSAGPFRILALGDDYTIGERVPRSESWPLQLREELRAAGFEVSEPLVIAQAGWTTRDLASGVSSLPAGPYDLVTLQIGVNNEFQGWLADEFRPELVALMERALAFAGAERARVILLSLPDYGVTPAQNGLSSEVIAASIDRFNAVIAEEAARFGYEYIDVTEISREAGEDSTLLASDELHPSALMYARWVELLVPTVASRFASLGAASARWSAEQIAEYGNEVRLRRHP